MRKRNFLIFMSLVLAVVDWSSGVATAQNNPNGNGAINRHSKIADKLKQVGARKNAAKLLQDAGIMVAAPEALVIDPATGHMVPDYFGVANWAFSPPLTKFIDPLPNLTVAVPDTITYPGSDYYEISFVQFTQQMHTDLPPTTLRGYVQTNSGTDASGTNSIAPPAIAYMGPIIVAQRDRPVRVKFTNALPPTDAGGDLFIPVDPSVMGSGMGPEAPAGAMDQDCNPTSSPRPSWCYSQNRAAVHLHGNNTIWISDGWPHQQITPAGETAPNIDGITNYKGVSNYNVPDMWFDATGATIASCAGQLTCTASGATNDPGPGAWTLYYTNAQSARLMFYHDHAYGLTRLNVYVGGAAGYLVTDSVESDLINGTNVTGVNPTGLKVLPDIGIPLVIQDKTFVDATPVPDPANPTATVPAISLTDPTWLDPTQVTFGTTPGTANTGDLWFPHVYMPNQNLSQIDGANPFGRWDYGPWWFPYVDPAGIPSVPGSALISGPLPNPYCLPTPGVDCSATPWENPTMPGTPSNSWTGEAFMDTPIVNGMAYPYLNVEPRAYRFRILNAANDRMFNLQMYVANPGIVGTLTTTPGSGYTADPVVTVTNDPSDTTGHGFTLTATADLTQFLADGVTPNQTYGQVTFAIQSVGSNYTAPPIINVAPALADTTGSGASATAVLYGAALGQDTEVGMIPLPAQEPSLVPYVNSGMPDQAFAGPDFWQIGTEGGFNPAPVDTPNQPIVFNLNPKTFNFGNVLQHALLIGSAERVDVVVDFSAFAGKTIIMYNDSPAAFPAADPRNDYYTADQDQTSTGGAPTTLPGFGPNTRTIMQFRVGTTVNSPNAATLANLKSVWASATGKPGVFEASQAPPIIPQAVYDSAYNSTFDATVPGQYIQVGQYTKTFQPIDSTGVLQPAVTLPIQPKATHDEMGGVWDRYGRMSGMLGLDVPGANAQTSQFIPYGFASPPVDLFSGTVSGTPIGSLGDGTQIWSIAQNGVDTHTIHFHLFNVQVINRVGWDGMLIPPDPIDIGWKETVRVNPLEIIFVAMRPIIPSAPQAFLNKIPNDVRPIDPTMPLGAMLNPPPNGWFDPNANAITSIFNHTVNYGWDYMWHCHILAHEENDMMHAFSVATPPAAPTNLNAAVTGSGINQSIALTWTDQSANETSFIAQRATDAGFTTNLVTFPVGPDVITYTDAAGTPGTTYFYRVYATNVVGDVDTPGFPTVTADSGFSNASSSCFLIGDFNGDGVVNQADYFLFRQYYRQSGTNLLADLNGDGVVNQLDFFIFRHNLGTSCP
ncbi:MAG: multicopper oxidase domain-containing protein [Desulfobulbaceae bacterium]|nr:multicopper oxidase domain-containing protein [Desulfobulbaceae bacterium]